jgi:tetratricopeptide (TPR) repeat protein
VCAAFVLALLPSAAAAQQTTFSQTLSELTAAIEGTYGDEGTLVRPAIDRLAAALAQWDREIQAAAAAVSEASKTPSPGLVDRRIALARMYADRGRPADALSELDAAAVLEPRRAQVHVLRGLILEDTGNSADALEAFRTAHATDTANPVIGYYLFHYASRYGSPRDARDAASTLSASYAGLLKAPLGKTLEERRSGVPGDREERRSGVPGDSAPFTRLSLLQPAASGPPLLPLAEYSKAYRHIVRREYDKAITEFRSAADRDPLVADPATGSAAIIRAISALRQGRLSDAEALIQQSGRLGESSEAHRVLGLVYWARSEHGKSVAELTTAISRSPRNERARLALARVLASAGRDDESTLALEETIRILPDCMLAHWWLALAHEKVNRFTEARLESELVAAAAVAGASPLHASVGRSAVSAADLPGAVAAYTRAVSANPNDPAMHKFLAAALIQLDRTGEAFAEFVAALLIDPADAEAHAGIGHIQLNAGHDEDAVEALRHALDLAPENLDARYALASALERVGRSAEAAQHFARVEQAQRQALTDRRRTMSLGVLKEEAALRASEGQLEAAIALYEKALVVDAEPAVYGRLTDLYSKVGRALDAARARAIYEKALHADRGDGSVPR